MRRTSILLQLILNFLVLNVQLLDGSLDHHVDSRSDRNTHLLKSSDNILLLVSFLDNTSCADLLSSCLLYTSDAADEEDS